MSETVNLPALGESVTEGTVTRWLKQVGESIEVDEPLVEISTDKVDTEVPSPVAGVIEEILVEEDEEVEVGAPLVKIGDGSGSGSSDSGSPDDAEEQSQDEAPAEEESADEDSSSEQESAPAQAESSDSGSSEDSGEGQEVTLPALGESVTEGTVTRWLKEVGESIEVDEPLVEISTDKVDTEVPSPVAGTLLEIKVQEDEEAEVGQVLAIVGSGSASSSSSAPQQEEPQQEEAPKEEKQQEEPKKDEAPKESAPAPQKEETKEQAPQQASSSSESSSQGNGTAYVTPLVRKLAKQEGIDLSTVQGTGVGGRIRKQDVQAAVEAKKSSAPAAQESAPATSAQKSEAPVAPAPSAKRGTTEKAPRIRQVIAKRMKESLEVSAQLTQVTEVDMTRIAQLRNKAKNDFQAREGAKLTFLPFFAKATAEALQQHPVLNASFDEEKKEITYNSSEDIAFAVDTPRGLLVPVVPNAGDLNLAGLAKKIADVGARTKDGSIGPNELSGGTFTITNIGSFGALFDTPIINQPQVAILGTGTIVKRPMVVQDADGNDTIAIRQMCYLSLTYDHRLVDGADAGRFLATMKKRLEEGNFSSEVGL